MHNIFNSKPEIPIGTIQFYKHRWWSPWYVQEWIGMEWHTLREATADELPKWCLEYDRMVIENPESRTTSTPPTGREQKSPPPTEGSLLRRRQILERFI